MAKRFIIATNGMAASKRDKITTYLSGQDWGFWHWFSEVWIIVSVPDSYSAKVLWNEVITATDLEADTMMVLELPDGKIGYWGRTNKNGWKWMDENLNP
jgi:hypothetical protein